ncbi:hypothetical protein [Herbaspirillum sp.]|uniref:hypothetical protein n=1 Tax=Herbaspirillum sp. TaxID=1890675 RepID=UPI001B2E2D44|nr:hypothetical protein [Herbaspirillum sp.]MBO9535253.1 hypothetical protein [Herbaspirillum sp.]
MDDLPDYLNADWRTDEKLNIGSAFIYRLSPPTKDRAILIDSAFGSSVIIRLD